MKTGFLEKLIERLSRLDPGSMQAQFLRLASEKGFLEAVFQALQEGLMVLDGAGRIVYANRAITRLLGIPYERALGEPVRKYLKEIEWDRILRLDEGKWSELINRELEVTYPEHRFLALYLVPLSTVSAQERGAVLILRDVTRERQQEAHTIESERLNALTLLAAGVAHEIGNPLNSLNIHLQLIERELRALQEPGRASLEELVGIARKEVARLDQILTQFLRAIRPSMPKLEPASLREVLKDTLAFLQHEIRDRDVLVEVEGPENLPLVQMDKNQIRQAFFNIIRNAIQAMNGGGLLKITLAASDRFAIISFKDTGPGIEPGDLGGIFDAYRTTKPGGTGLGLMIVQRIVRDHGGEIEVHSEPRSGATFTLCLPLEAHRVRLLASRASPSNQEDPG